MRNLTPAYMEVPYSAAGGWSDDVTPAIIFFVTLGSLKLDLTLRETFPFVLTVRTKGKQSQEERAVKYERRAQDG